MFKQTALLFLLGHALGDFYFQNDAMARRKQEKLPWLLLHGLLYWLALLLVCLPVFSLPLLLAASAAAGLHLAVDGGKFRFNHFFCGI